MTDQHFILTDDNELQEILAADVQAIWNGETFVDGVAARLVSVFYNDAGRPRVVFLLQLAAPYGLVTPDARNAAMDAFHELAANRSRRSAFAMPSSAAWRKECVSELLSGWPPRDLLQRLLAEYTGLKPWHFAEFAIGGPVLESAESGEDVAQSIERIAAELGQGWQPRPRQFEFCQVDFTGDNGELMIDALRRMDVRPAELTTAAVEAEFSPHSPARQEAIVRLIEFLVLTTFGYGRRYERFKYLVGVNPDIYRLSFGRSALVVNLDNRTLIPLGHVNGFSGILPLTPAGFERYLTNQRAASELTAPDDIVPAPYQPRTIDHLLIAGVVFLPSAPRMINAQRIGAAFSYDDDHRYHLFANEGGELFRECFLPHLWQLMTPVAAAVHPGGPHAILGPEDRLWPKIACPISGLGMGEPYLVRAGFEQPRLLPEDIRGNKKYLFDFEDINSQAVSLKRRTRMAHLAEIVSRRYGQPLF